MAKSRRKTSLGSSGNSANHLFNRLGPAAEEKNVFTGMIKRADGDPNSIMFARPGDCSKWVKIPADQVADVKLIHLVSCEGHSHHLVHVFMKGPASSEGKTFAALAQLHHAPPTLSTSAAVPTHGLRSTMAITQPGSSPCWYDASLGRIVCPS